MTNETRIELHGLDCSCRGGAWALLLETQRSPCSGEAYATAEKLVLGLEEWRQLGKPASLELFREGQGRVERGERREFQRFEVALRVRIERIPTWRDPTQQGEDTLAEIIAAGGALVRSRMAVERGDLIRFRLGAYETRCEVMYVSTGAGAGLDGAQRLGLKFLDAPLPPELIPKDARPLE